MPQGDKTTLKGGPACLQPLWRAPGPPQKQGSSSSIRAQRRNAAVSQPFKSAHTENMEAEDSIATELVQCTGLRLSPGRTTLPHISQAQPGLGRILTLDPNSSIYDETADMIQMQFCLAPNDAHFPATCAIYLISRFLPKIFPFSKLNKWASFGNIFLNYIYIYYINLEHLKWFFKIYLNLHANHWLYLIRNTSENSEDLSFKKWLMAAWVPKSCQYPCLNVSFLLW